MPNTERLESPSFNFTTRPGGDSVGCPSFSSGSPDSPSSPVPNSEGLRNRRKRSSQFSASRSEPSLNVKKSRKRDNTSFADYNGKNFASPLTSLSMNSLPNTYSQDGFMASPIDNRPRRFSQATMNEMPASYAQNALVCLNNPTSPLMPASVANMNQLLTPVSAGRPMNAGEVELGGAFCVRGNFNNPKGSSGMGVIGGILSVLRLCELINFIVNQAVRLKNFSYVLIVKTSILLLNLLLVVIGWLGANAQEKATNFFLKLFDALEVPVDLGTVCSASEAFAYYLSDGETIPYMRYRHTEEDLSAAHRSALESTLNYLEKNKVNYEDRVSIIRILKYRLTRKPGLQELDILANIQKTLFSYAGQKKDGLDSPQLLAKMVLLDSRALMRAEKISSTTSNASSVSS